MPVGAEISFSKRWRTIAPSTSVQVRTPHARHGNAGKPSHAAKPTVLEHFLEFVDCNSQPNGRAADSSGPTLLLQPAVHDDPDPKRRESRIMKNAYVDQLWANSIGPREKVDFPKCQTVHPIIGCTPTDQRSRSARIKKTIAIHAVNTKLK